jgi:hypothetical protein
MPPPRATLNGPDMNLEFPIRYIEPVFRPPSEAESLILPVTNGCSWNRCTYCEMYTAPQKKFALRGEDETLEVDPPQRRVSIDGPGCSGCFWAMAMRWPCPRAGS